MADCENPYPFWKPPRGGDQLRDNDMHIAFNEGQQNPDPKQYAKREELVEEIRRCTLTMDDILEDYDPEGEVAVITYPGVVDIIKNHGLEENRMSLIDLRSDEVISKEG